MFNQFHTPPRAISSMTIGIIGLGSLGSALLESFLFVLEKNRRKSPQENSSNSFEFSTSFRLIAYTSKPEIHKKKLSEFIHQDYPNVEFRQIESIENDTLPEWLFLTVPDNTIPEIVAKLNPRQHTEWSESSVIHCSGALSSHTLQSISDLGGKVASLHPIQTFPGTTIHPTMKNPTNRFEGTPCSVEGDPQLVDSLIEFFSSELLAKPFKVTPEQKAALHLAAVFASNSLVPLLSSAKEILQKAGLEDGLSRLKPLFETTFENVFHLGENALSGPVKRGDLSTLLIHMEQLQEQPVLRYRYARSGLMIHSLLPKETQQMEVYRSIRELFLKILSEEQES